MVIRSIHIQEHDAARLRTLLQAGRAAVRDQEHLEKLAEELDRAMVVGIAEMPPDVVTMGTQVRVRDLESGKRETYTLAYPSEADVASNRVSVLAPLGTALLGYREGDTIEWPMPGGLRRLFVEKVLYQPEAAQRTQGAEGNAGSHGAPRH